jgi:hypothetical protein
MSCWKAAYISDYSNVLQTTEKSGPSLDAGCLKNEENQRQTGQHGNHQQDDKNRNFYCRIPLRKIFGCAGRSHKE